MVLLKVLLTYVVIKTIVIEIIKILYIYIFIYIYIYIYYSKDNIW